MYKFEGQITHLRELFTNPGSYGIGQYIAYGQIGHYGQVVYIACPITHITIYRQYNSN